MKRVIFSTLILITSATLFFLPHSFAQPANTLGVIYFLPSGRESHQNIDTKIDALLKDVQTFYANEMERYGFGRKTFKLETHPNGKVQVHHINGKFGAAYYNAEYGAFDKILAEIDEQFDTSQSLYFIVADVTYPSSHWRGGGQAYLGGTSIVYIPFEDVDESGQAFVRRYIAGHELAHSFGLQHDLRFRTKRGEADITSYTVGIDFENRRLSKCAAEWLDVRPYFNAAQPSLGPTTIEMLSPREYPPNAISLRFNVTDPDGLHQAQLFMPREHGTSLHGCKSLNGEVSNIIEFITTELMARADDTIQLGIIDVHGSFRWESFSIERDDIERVAGVIAVDNSAAVQIRIVSGDSQDGYLNSRLVAPFVVTVRDAEDEPVAGAQVTFQAVAGGGTLSVTNPYTDSDGRARTYLTLGSSRTDNRVAASVDGVSDQVIFHATVNNETVTIAAPLKTLSGHRDNVMSVEYSPDGSIIATGSWDGTIRLWDGRTGEIKKTLAGHTSEVSSVAFSPDGLTLASGLGNGTIRFWDVETGNQKLEFSGLSYLIPVVAYFPDGSKIASGTLEGDIHVWDSLTGQRITSFSAHTDHNVTNVTSIAFSRDGGILASGGSDAIARLWDANTGQQLRTFEDDKAIYTDSVRVALNHDGSILATTGAWNLTVSLWDTTTGQHLKTLKGHKTGVYTVAFSPDGAMLATASSDGEIRSWDTTTGLLQKILIGHTEIVLSLAFSPNGDTLVSGSNDDTVLLWNLAPSPTVDSTVSMTPALAASPSVGEQLTISLDIASGSDVVGYQASVSFDPTALRYVEAASGDYLPANSFFVPPVIDVNRVTLGGAAFVGASDGEGTLATLTFEVVESRLSFLTLSGVSLVNTDGERLLPHLEHGRVIRPEPLLGDVNGDGEVNILDLVQVAANLGKIGENDADVNGDGVVDILDLVQVAGVIGGGGAAPSAHFLTLSGFGKADIERWLAQAREIELGDLSSQQGIRFLEQLLAALTPNETALLPNYPNPFNPETWIPYQLTHDTHVKLTIYDANGALVRLLDVGHQPAGFYTDRRRAAYWDGRNENGEAVASGVYFYTLTAGDFAATRKMLIRK